MTDGLLQMPGNRSFAHMLYNTFGLRFIAAIIDNVLLWPLIFVNAKGDGKVGLVAILVMILGHSYFIIGHAQYGQTLGKRIMKLKVVSTHEHLSIGWKEAFMRELLWILLSIATTFLLKDLSMNWVMVPALSLILLDATIAAIHPQNRSLRDFIARTVVIRHTPQPLV